MKKETKISCQCGHYRRHHAIAENHNLGTNHCTSCACKEYSEKTTE